MMTYREDIPFFNDLPPKAEAAAARLWDAVKSPDYNGARAYNDFVQDLAFQKVDAPPRGVVKRWVAGVQANLVKRPGGPAPKRAAAERQLADVVVVDPTGGELVQAVITASMDAETREIAVAMHTPPRGAIQCQQPVNHRRCIRAGARSPGAARHRSRRVIFGQGALPAARPDGGRGAAVDPAGCSRQSAPPGRWTTSRNSRSDGGVKMSAHQPISALYLRVAKKAALDEANALIERCGPDYIQYEALRSHLLALCFPEAALPSDEEIQPLLQLRRRGQLTHEGYVSLLRFPLVPSKAGVGIAPKALQEALQLFCGAIEEGLSYEALVENVSRKLAASRRAQGVEAGEA